MKLSKYISAALFLVALLFVFSSISPTVFADSTTAGGIPDATTVGGIPDATTQGGAPTTLPNPLKNVKSINDLLYLIANIATYIGVILAVLALIWVGFKFVAAQGNPDKITEAKNYFFYIIIGVAILIGASAIISILKETLTSAGVVQSSTFTNPN